MISKKGQGYDGAKNMSSEQVGVQAYIKWISPLQSILIVVVISLIY